MRGQITLPTRSGRSPVALIHPPVDIPLHPSGKTLISTLVGTGAVSSQASPVTHRDRSPIVGDTDDMYCHSVSRRAKDDRSSMGVMRNEYCLSWITVIGTRFLSQLDLPVRNVQGGEEKGRSRAWVLVKHATAKTIKSHCPLLAVTDETDVSCNSFERAG
jgi:hypothetical protein